MAIAVAWTPLRQQCRAEGWLQSLSECRVKRDRRITELLSLTATCGGYLVPSPLLKAGSAGAECLGPCPVGS